MSVINIDERIGSGSITLESEEEQRSRLRRAEADARHRRWHGTLLFVALLLASAVVFTIGVDVALHANHPDEKKFAWAILSAIVSGTVGFKVGGATGGG